MEELKFIVDINAGKVAYWLRVMGYDALLFKEPDDSILVKTALMQDRIILTRDREIFKRRLVSSGKVRAMLLQDYSVTNQVKSVMEFYKLDYNYSPFSLCLECNTKLESRIGEEVRDRIPPHVYKTHSTYMECPACHRLYWKGTHWEAMSRRLAAMSRAE
jgi:uncharacterized protein with PIN domain